MRADNRRLVLHLVTVSWALATPVRLRHHIMSDGSLVHEITPAETYQIDSDEYDSEAGIDDLGDEEYDRLVEEGGHRCTGSTCSNPLSPALGLGGSRMWSRNGDRRDPEIELTPA